MRPWDLCSTPVRMLYEFHTEQNGKRSGSVHATYMLYGFRKAAPTNGHSQQDGDVEMMSSPPELESVADGGPVITLSLVSEESLEGRLHTSALMTSEALADPLTDALSQYQSVNSIHVYSLGTHAVKVRPARFACDLPVNKYYCRIFNCLPMYRNPPLDRRLRTGRSSVKTPSDPFAIHMCGGESAREQSPSSMWRSPKQLAQSQLPRSQHQLHKSRKKLPRRKSRAPRNPPRCRQVRRNRHLL